MPVIINELEHVAAPEESRAGSATGNPSAASGQGPSPSALQAQVMTAIRRVATRQARLWAD